MVTSLVLEKPREYMNVDYDGLWKKLIYELFEEFLLFFAAHLSQITKVNLPKTNSALFWEQFTNLGTKFKRNWKIGQFSPLPKMKGPITSNLFSYSCSFKLLYTLNHESKSLFMKVTFLYL